MTWSKLVTPGSICKLSRIRYYAYKSIQQAGGLTSTSSCIFLTFSQWEGLPPIWAHAFKRIRLFAMIPYCKNHRYCFCGVCCKKETFSSGVNFIPSCIIHQGHKISSVCLCVLVHYLELLRLNKNQTFQIRSYLSESDGVIFEPTCAYCTVGSYASLCVRLDYGIIAVTGQVAFLIKTSEDFCNPKKVSVNLKVGPVFKSRGLKDSSLTNTLPWGQVNALMFS